VDSFRELLTMKPAEREQYFTNRPPQVREQLEQKIHEYEAMTPDVREARLRATQLHWYLSRFIPVPASNATFQLSAVPDGYRAFVSNRLSQFQLLPPALRQDVLAHPTTAGYFLGRAATNAAGAPPPPPALPAPLATIGKLTAEQREKLFSNFARFFDLPAEQKQVVLARLAPADRSRVQAVLAAIERLPADQRVRGLQSISLLFTMTDDQQRELLRSAARRTPGLDQSRPPPPASPGAAFARSARLLAGRYQLTSGNRPLSPPGTLINLSPQCTTTHSKSAP
jgi:hypothetical protein